MGHGNCYGSIMDELVGLSRPCFIPSRTLQEKRAAKKEKPIAAKRRDQLYFEQDRDRQALHTLCRIYNTLKHRHPEHFLASSRNEALLSVCKMYQLIGDMHLLEMKLRAQFQSTNLWNEVHRKMVEAGIIQPAMSSASEVVDMEVDEPIEETSTADHIGGEVDAVLAEAGLVVHLEPALGVEDMEVEPIREEDSTVDATRRPVKRRRSIDDATETDVALALEHESKRFCLRANTTSEVHRHVIKRKWIGSALERKSKRACFRADDSHVQAEVVEVSRFIDYSLFHCCVYFLHPNLIYLIVQSISCHRVSQDLPTAETEPVAEDISFEVADDTIVEDVVIAEEAPTELVREEVEATPQAALRREAAALQSSLGPYWVPRHSSRVRKRPDYYVPSV